MVPGQAVGGGGGGGGRGGGGVRGGGSGGGGGDWGRGGVGVGGRGLSAAQNGADTLAHRGGATYYEQIMQELDPLMKASTLIIDDRVIRYVGYWLKMCIDCSAVVIENCVRRPARAGGLYWPHVALAHGSTVGIHSAMWSPIHARRYVGVVNPAQSPSGRPVWTRDWAVDRRSSIVEGPHPASRGRQNPASRVTFTGRPTIYPVSTPFNYRRHRRL